MHVLCFCFADVHTVTSLVEDGTSMSNITLSATLTCGMLAQLGDSRSKLMEFCI